MKKLLVLYPHPVDRDAFLSYYESRHLPKVHDLPGLLSASFSVAEDNSSPYFVYFEATFEDKQALTKAMISEAGGFLASDIANFSPKGAVTITSETRVVKHAVAGADG
ncbi:EthD family reductase [Alloalcanivorax profundimaris]|uniref:EthD family reductase n=1 Tax=Alloalcanivorax profundimaris TaxID=2735259 RepID=UPI001888E871|nr:EthD family reductase [Alloalcanivorax profundimaris]MBF1801841.1 EthD family reductase [Alloalcanivorax profundimaris]